jgi:hypothetical protein
MTALTLEVADVMRAYGPAYVEAFGDQLSAAQRRVLRDLVRCRTGELDGPSRPAISVATAASPTTPAATATAPSARRRAVPAGSTSALPSYSPPKTSTSS